MGKSFPFISEIDYIELVVILFILPSKQTLGKRPQLISSSPRIKGTLNPVYLKGNLFFLIFFTTHHELHTNYTIYNTITNKFLMLYKQR